MYIVIFLHWVQSKLKNLSQDLSANSSHLGVNFFK